MGPVALELGAASFAHCALLLRGGETGPELPKIPYLVVQYLGVLKVNLWDSKGNLLTQKG